MDLDFCADSLCFWLVLLFAPSIFLAPPPFFSFTSRLLCLFLMLLEGVAACILSFERWVRVASALGF